MKLYNLICHHNMYTKLTDLKRDKHYLGLMQKKPLKVTNPALINEIIAIQLLTIIQVKHDKSISLFNYDGSIQAYILFYSFFYN